MKKFFKAVGILAGIFVAIIAVWIFHNSVYPLTTTHPNFSDVERVFNKMQFPGGWKEIDSSENRGVAGRLCPIESSTKCYHKRKLFKVENNTTQQYLGTIIKTTGCPSVSYSDEMVGGGTPYSNYTCSIEGLTVSGTLYKRPSGWEASFSVSDR